MPTLRKTTLAAALALVVAPALAAEFQQLDTNRDQQLSRTELESFAREQQQSADQLLQTFDRDQNQQLSQQEFADITSAPMQAAEADSSNAPVLGASSDQPAGDQISGIGAVSSDQQAQVTSEGQAPQTQPSASPDRTTITVNEKPAKVTVSNTAPKVTVHQPKPEVSITTQEPVVNVEQSEPQVSVNQAEPQVAVDPGQPAVNVAQPEPRVSVNQPEPEVTSQIAEPLVTTQEPEREEIQVGSQPELADPVSQPLVNIGTSTQWTSQSVGDLQGETLHDQNGQPLGDVVEVVLDASQQPGVLVQAAGQGEMSFVALDEINYEQDQLRVSDSQQVQPLSGLLEGDRSQLQTITDPNRSVRSLLDDNAVSVRY